MTMSDRMRPPWTGRRAIPDSRVQPLFGIELTTWAFKHILIYIFQPPFPTRTFKKFMPLGKAVQAGKAAGGLVIVPHVDAFWVGMGRHRLERQFQQLGVDGIELLTPVPFARGAVDKLAEMNGRCRLIELGGSDAHHLEDLYRVIVEFPGQTLADFETAIRAGTTSVRWGTDGPKIPMSRQVRQHTKALVVHPWEQLQHWSQDKLSNTSASTNFPGDQCSAGQQDRTRPPRYRTVRALASPPRRSIPEGVLSRGLPTHERLPGRTTLSRPRTGRSAR